MALPSSPPLIPEADLPSSPPLVPISSSILPRAPARRKRHLFEHEESLSSDPLFSEDPSEGEDLASYDRPKRKRMFRGPWYEMVRKSSRSGLVEGSAKDGFRTADSGVWMGSDDSIDSVLLNQSRQPASNPSGPVAQAQIVPSGAEQIANDIIQECVEAGKESIDLSDLGLTQLLPSTLRPLHQLIRQSHTNLTEAPSEDEFSALTPSIQIFLARNALSSLPSELFHLENITVLSLRNNELRELPPCISRLTRLQELNLAGNSIRYLPWELFPFFDRKGHHSRITIRPNPLLEPMHITGPSPLLSRPGPRPALYHEDISGADAIRTFFEECRRAYREESPLDLRSELELRLDLGRALRTQYVLEAPGGGRNLSVCREELIYLASSAIQYFGVQGPNIARATEDERAHPAVIHADSGRQVDQSRSAAPSLFELALKGVQKEYLLDDFPPDLPVAVEAALKRAADGTRAGNQSCSTCGRPFIIPRAQWIEYWHNGLRSQSGLTQETIIPFIRNACTWRCAEPSEPGEFRG